MQGEQADWQREQHLCSAKCPAEIGDRTGCEFRSIYRGLYQLEVIQTRDEFPLFGPPRNGWVQRCIPDHLGLLKRRQLMKVTQKLKEAHIAWQSRFAHTPKHPQIGLQQGKEAFRPILMHVPARVFLLRVIHGIEDVSEVLICYPLSCS